MTERETQQLGVEPDPLPAETEAWVRDNAKQILAACVLSMFPKTFFPGMKAAAAEAVRAWYEPLAFQVRALAQRLEALEGKYAELAHRFGEIEEGIRLVLAEVGHPVRARSA